MLTQRRAAIGGEIGANGEFYEGGKFIATTDHAKGKPGKKAVARKVEIMPYTWEMQPTPEARPIFSYVGTALKIASFDYASRVCKLEVFATVGMSWAGPGYEVTADDIAFYEQLVARFNAGERWV